MDFSTLRGLTIPEGPVKSLAIDGVDVWHRKFSYVSLGDSIAAGHFIRNEERLNIPRCWEWQYGDYKEKDANGNIIAEFHNDSTELISGCYTDLIRAKLEEKYGSNHVKVTTYARSGDTNTDLRAKLEHEKVQNDIAKAELVTVCIGANTVLGKAITQIGDFITKGAPTLQDLEKEFNKELEEGGEGFKLLEAGETVTGSYRNIFAKLASINKNPNAKFVFTTVYNPYKYLWLDPSTDDNNYTNGYFGPTCSIAPNIEVVNPLTGNDIIDVRKFIYTFEVSIPDIGGSVSLKLLTQRVNDPFKDYPEYWEQEGCGRFTLAEWVEKQVTSINTALADAIEWARDKDNGMGDERFILADTKSVFDSVPDNLIASNRHYSDLVNVELVRGETALTLNWGELHDTWEGNSLIENAKNIVWDTVFKVVMPDLDPHPEGYGQYAMYRSFADALACVDDTFGWESLVNITYNANGGSGDMDTQKVLGAYNGNAVNFMLNPNAFASTKTGYYFSGWNTASGGGGTRYIPTEKLPYIVGNIYAEITSDVTLYAQWNGVKIKYYKTCEIQGVQAQVAFGNGDGETGPITAEGQGEYHLKLRIGQDTSNPPGLNSDTFSNQSTPMRETEVVPDDTDIFIQLVNRTSGEKCEVWVDGSRQAGPSQFLTYTHTPKLTANMVLQFHWIASGGVVTGNAQNYWFCGISTK